MCVPIEDNQDILDRKASDEELGGEVLHGNWDVRLYITGRVINESKPMYLGHHYHQTCNYNVQRKFPPAHSSTR